LALLMMNVREWNNPPNAVAAAVLFMLTRPRSVTVRDLVILPQSLDL